MNFIPSIIIYNPLETMVLILLMGTMSKGRLRFSSLMANSYILGTINLLFQYMVEFTYGTFLYSVLVVILNFAISPTVIYYYCRYIIGYELKFSTAYILKLCFTASSLMIVLLINYVGIIDIFFSSFAISQEFIANLIIRVIQLVILGVIKLIKGGFDNERISKETFRE